MNATFPKSERLCSKIGIEELFANGESRRSGGLTVRFLRVHVGAGISTPLNDRSSVKAIKYSTSTKTR